MEKDHFYLVTNVICSSSLLGHWITLSSDSSMPQDTNASPPDSYEARWYRNENRAVANGCGKDATAVFTEVVGVRLFVPLLVKLIIQFLTMTGKNPWKFAAPVASIIVLSLGKFGFLSRWMIEVSALSTAALISIKCSPFISRTSTSSSSRPEYKRPWNKIIIHNITYLFNKI